ncbi:acyl-CoA thioesterase [Streptomyces sp. NPDC050560]|uniref:acyl-CoA thioesterase n=1 Tax=Streptomyces sp. NPDC050560 TaxID=3365630 RepID=UPI0037A767FD
MARHIYRCPLRWSDMDAFGHVNNVVFLRYLEEARVDFMFRPAPDGVTSSFTEGTVVARHEIDYVRPLVHRHEPVTVETWVTRIRSAAVTLSYEVKDYAAGEPAVEGGERPDVLYARASTVIVPYDLDAKRPRRLTADELAFLEGFLDGRDEGREKSRALVA